MKLKLKDYFFVGIQFFLFFLYLFNKTIFKIESPSIVRYSFLIVSIIGGAILLLALLQLNKNLSPFPTPKSNSKLIQVGLYKYIRHPIYTGIFLMLFGYGIHLSSSSKIIIALILIVLFFYKSSYEEQLLLTKYLDYPKYKKKTGRFFPKL